MDISVICFLGEFAKKTVSNKTANRSNIVSDREGFDII